MTADNVGSDSPERKLERKIAAKIKSAMSMIGRGFFVFRLRPTGNYKERKKPFETGWQQIATQDPELVKRWWTEEPGCGIGAKTDGFLVLDLDPRPTDPDDDGRDPSFILSELRLQVEKEFGPIPSTLVLSTGGGGRHMVLRLPKGLEPRAIKNAIGLIRGVDIRTDGGYIVAPGSKLSVDTPRYSVYVDVPIAEAPSRLVSALRQRSFRSVGGTDMEGLDEPLAIKLATHFAQNFPEVSEGQRNTKAHEFAHVMRDCGVSAGVAFDLLQEHWNQQNVHPPLDAEELKTTVNSAYAKDSKDRVTRDGYLYEELKATMEQGEACREAHATATEADMLDVVFPDDIDLAAMEGRDWVIEGVACKGYVTALFGYAGVSKSTWLLHLAIAIAADRPDMVQTPHGLLTELKPGVVLVYNGEDDTLEMKRRLGAEMKANGVPFETMKRVGISSGADDGVEPLMLAKASGDTAEINEASLNRLIRTAKHHKVDVVILDPLAEIHNIVENSNDQNKVIGAAMRRIAKATGAAVIFAAHSRKPSNGNQNVQRGNLHELRGGGSLGGVIRIAHEVATMTAPEATAVGVPVEKRHAYVGVAMAKNNLGPTEQDVCWYKRVGVPMGPPDKQFFVGALVPQAFTRVQQTSEPLWLLFERVMTDNPLVFKVGHAVNATEILTRCLPEERLRFEGGRLAIEIENWVKESPVKQGIAYNVQAEMVDISTKRDKTAGKTRWRYQFTLLEKPDDEETDFLS